MDAEMAGVAPVTTATNVHSQFGPGNGTDLKIQSSDGVIFHVNRSNLDRCAEAFPGSDAAGITSESKDVVHLTETAAVLEILFQFGYPTRHPVLDNLEFKKLLAVADAAEKYHFYSAAPMCQIVLRHNIPKHPLEIFRHAIKHDYPKDFIDEVALALRTVPVSSASDPRVHPSVAPAWLVYQGKWNNIFKRACDTARRRTLEFFDPELSDDEQLQYDCGPVPLAESWPSDAAKNLFSTPLPSHVSSALERCPCPPPWDREISEQTNLKVSKYGKEVQNLAVIDHIKGECLSAVHDLESLSALMKKVSR